MSVFRAGTNKSSVNNFPNIRPTLDLDFANTKTLDPRIEFTRASGGSYVGADGLIKYAGVNEARFDHDPETGESLGLLVEEARTNVFTWSEDFTTWSKPAGTKIIPNAIVAPDGTLTAEKLVEDSILGLHYVFKTNSVTSGTTYTMSGYVKAAERTEVYLIFSNYSGAFTNNSFASFNLISGTFREIGSSVTNYGSEKLPNGWYRVWITATAIATVTVPIISPFYISNGTTRFYIGDGTSGIYIWGAQLEQGSFPTSYIPTQGSTRTRQRDNAQITGKNFSDFYRQDEGTVFSQAIGIDNISGGNTRRYYEFNNSGSSNFRILSGYNSSNLVRLLVVNNGEVQASIFDTNQSPFKKSIKTAASFKQNYFRFYSNNIKANTDDFGTLPIVNVLFIGGGGLSSELALNGTISRFTYWPKILTESQLQVLTR